MNTTSPQDSGVPPAASFLQPRELQIQEQMHDLLSAFGPLTADQIASKLKEKHILILSLLDKLASADQMHRCRDGRFSLTPEVSEAVPTGMVESLSDALTRSGQARLLLDLWRILSSSADLDLMVNRTLEARYRGQLIARARFDPSSVPIVEISGVSFENQEESPPPIRTIRVWGRIQAESALAAIRQLVEGISENCRVRQA